ncbi:disulfide bond formation protein DsbA [Cronobacter dublinensis subsp. dublinensis]|nr:disulfide bond formation protein DsbA [Cronobacter dublinensis subsp. dublinensis]
MSTQSNWKNAVLFLFPLAILIATASYIAYSVHKQGRLLDDVAFMVQKNNPVVTSRDQLAEFFAEYVAAGGLNISSNKVSDTNPKGALQGNKSGKSFDPSPSAERIYGNPDAQFYIIEYSDFECPYCKEHFPQLLKLVDNSSGNIALVFKHVPVHGQASQVESIASECAAEQNGNPGFYKMATAIFENTQSDGRGLTTPLDVLASRNGLDGKRLIQCVNEARPSQKIAADVREAAGLNIQKTPSTIVVHGERSALVQGMVNGTGLMQMKAQLVDGSAPEQKN